MIGGTFAACINCIDGRVQKCVTDYIISKFKVDHVDMITEPGPDKVLSEHNDPIVIGSIKKKLIISAEKHASKVVAIAGHHDCAANPVDKDVHFRQIRESIKNISDWDVGIDVCGLWVDENQRVTLVDDGQDENGYK